MSVILFIIAIVCFCEGHWWWAAFWFFLTAMCL